MEQERERQKQGEEQRVYKSSCVSWIPWRVCSRSKLLTHKPIASYRP